jgi:hypothetical protein
MNVVLADEFRDGNVPAMMSPLTAAKQAYAALPETVTEYYYRGDSASHESHLIHWLRNEKREDGPQGFIGFAISARMSDALHQAILKVSEADWQAYGNADAREIRESAEVSFVPGEKSEHKDTQPLRYVAIRIRQRQEALFEDGSKVKHFAVVTNIGEWKAGRLIEWHREKAGTVEGVHDVVKNELAGGVNAEQVFWGECGVVAAGGDCAQRADSAKAAGATGGDVDGAAEAVAFSGVQCAGAAGTSRAETGATVGD